MKNSEEREDCPGDDHPVHQQPGEINSEFSRAEKWVIYSCIAVVVIMAIVMVCSI